MEIDIEKTKAAMIAAVSAALRYKEENPSVTEKNVINYIVNRFDNIIKEIENFGQ